MSGAGAPLELIERLFYYFRSEEADMARTAGSDGEKTEAAIREAAVEPHRAAWL